MVYRRQNNEFPGSRLYVTSPQHRADDRRARGAGPHDGTSIFPRYAADGEDGQIDRGADPPQFIQTLRGAGVLGRRRKNRAEPDVIRAVGSSRARLRQAVGRNADKSFPPKQDPGGVDGQVILAEVNAVRVYRFRDIRMVVDDEYSAAVSDGDRQPARSLVDPPSCSFFISILEQPDARVERPGQDILFPAPDILVVEDQAEPGDLTSPGYCTAP